jgi:membrane protease subunit (stomatin/prohibitin family)
MGIINGLKRQLRSVIEWDTDDGSQLFYQWSDNGDEIKNASRLVVTPGQGCIFVHRGDIQAIHDQPGVFPLKTGNIPFVTTLVKVMQFFESEHKVGVFFYRKTRVLNQKWGTRTPIKYQDPKYDFPVTLRAYGNYSFQLVDPESFFVNVLGNRPAFSLSDLRDVMTGRLVQPLSDYLAEHRFSYAEIDANRNEIAIGMADILGRDFARLGLDITDLRIEGTDFDEQTLTRINRIADITAESIAARKSGMDYAELQRLEALRAAAENESGAAGAGVGIGAGIGLGQQMAGHMQPGDKTSRTTHDNDIIGKLALLKSLRAQDLITEAEYNARKQDLLDRL